MYDLVLDKGIQMEKFIETASTTVLTVPMKSGERLSKPSFHGMFSAENCFVPNQYKLRASMRNCAHLLVFFNTQRGEICFCVGCIQLALSGEKQ